MASAADNASSDGIALALPIRTVTGGAGMGQANATRREHIGRSSPRQTQHQREWQQEHKESFHSFPYTCPDDRGPIEPSEPRPGPYALPTPAGCRGSSTGPSGCADRSR